MKFLKWVANLIWLVLWGQSGQPAQPAPAVEADFDETAEAAAAIAAAGMAECVASEAIFAEARQPSPQELRRQAQLGLQARIQAAVDGNAGGLTLTPADTLLGLPVGLSLTATGLIDPAGLADYPVGRDNSAFPAYRRKLLEEAMETPEGEFVAAKQAAAEEYAEKLELTLTPADHAKLPSKLRPHVRFIDPVIVSSNRGPIRESTQERSRGDA